jgi:ribonuclease P protein component
MRRSWTDATLGFVKPRTLTFGKEKRLTRTMEFARVREKGKVYRGDLLTIGMAIDEETSGFRAGFITSRKVGAAVVRNRLRRRLRDIVRRHQRELRSGIWIVMIARPAAALSSYGALEDEWLRLAKRASILARS